MAKVSKKTVQANSEVALFGKNSKYDAGILENVGINGDMLSLTDLWKAAGNPNKKDPNTWLNRESTTELIDFLCDNLNTPKMGVLKSKRGKTGGGTWGHKQIFLSYAKWLDPALHVLVNEVFFQRIEEEKNPDLIVDRAIATYKRKGYDEKWISSRLKGKTTRNEFTSCLASHGVERDGFRNCTNAIYGHLYGGTTAVIREKKHLPEKANIRDNMTLDELVAIDFAEMLARNTIKANNLYGNAKCEIASSNASKTVANAVVQSRKNINI